MAAEGERLDRLINDLLDVSRIQTGRLRLDRRPTDLRALLDAVVAKLRVAITTHEVILQNSHDHPIIAPVDAGRIEQVLANLITNATKYSAPLSPILVSLRATGDQAEIDVIDHGIGIPVTDLDHVFDRFYQVQRPARESRPGLGLGLFIAREIARQHGGEITVRSQELRGSQFTVQIPLVEPAKEFHDVERINHLST
jgi:signal transduction histidine kinase